MRKLWLCAAAAALLTPVLPATAEARPYGYYDGGRYSNDVRRERRECRRELRRADSRWEYRRELRECRREIARAKHDRRDWRRDRWRDDRYGDGYGWNDRRGYRNRDRYYYGW